MAAMARSATTARFGLWRVTANGDRIEVYRTQAGNANLAYRAMLRLVAVDDALHRRPWHSKTNANLPIGLPFTVQFQNAPVNEDRAVVARAGRAEPAHQGPIV